MKRPSNGRAVFHTRDSGGRHDMTPGQYVEWARKEALKHGVTFDGTPAVIEAMIRERVSHRGDIFLDYDVCGNDLQRPGLQKMLEVARQDLTVCRAFIPRRDRLARPDDPMDAMRIETDLRRMGVTLTYMALTLSPLGIGQRHDLGDLIVGLIDFEQAGKDRRILAEKILFAKLTLAKRGFATGGRPPYAFRRWLVRDDGVRIRELQDGERVRMAGHHVLWLPVPDEHPEMIVVRRILLLLETMPATRVAVHLTAEGVPAPNADKWRTDRGIAHKTSGVWHSNTVTNIATNPLLLAICAFGRRSMGDTLRFTPDGPRELIESDYRPDNGGPKVIVNDTANQIQVSATFSPLVDEDRHRTLLCDLKARGATTRQTAVTQPRTESAWRPCV